MNTIWTIDEDALARETPARRDWLNDHIDALRQYRILTTIDHALPNRPVVVVHLTDSQGQTTCTGDQAPGIGDRSYPTVPRYLCPLCQRTAERFEEKP